MNLIDAVVIEVIGEPFFVHQHWFIKVKADSMGGISTHDLMFPTEEECLKVEVGRKILI